MPTSETLVIDYNYDEFVPEKFLRWMNFQSSPPLGQTAPDFSLWPLEQEASQGETRLSEIWAENLYTIVEFGSFT